MSATYRIDPASSNRVLKLVIRPSSKWFIAGSLLLFGGTLLAGYFYPEAMHMNPSIRKTPWAYHAIGVIGGLISLWSLHAALDNPRITVDGHLREIRFECRWWGIFPKTKQIPFQDITGIQLLYHPKNASSLPYWQILIQKRDSAFLDTIDQGDDTLKPYLDEVVARTEKILEMPATQMRWGQ